MDFGGHFEKLSYPEFARVLIFSPTGILKTSIYTTQINIQTLKKKKCIRVCMAGPGSMFDLRLPGTSGVNFA